MFMFVFRVKTGKKDKYIPDKITRLNDFDIS